jgi:hypothetical protein
LHELCGFGSIADSVVNGDGGFHALIRIHTTEGARPADDYGNHPC